MGHWDNLADITPSESLPYIEPGQYVLEIDRCIIGTSTRGKGDFFVVEFTVVSSSNPRLQPGARCSMVQMFSKGEVALANIKMFAAATLKVEHTKITGAVMDTFTKDDGAPVKGKRVVCNAQLTKTRAGNDFTKLMWSAESGQSFKPVAGAGVTPATRPAPNPGTPAAAASSAYSSDPPETPIEVSSPATDEEVNALFGFGS